MMLINEQNLLYSSTLDKLGLSFVCNAPNIFEKMLHQIFLREMKLIQKSAEDKRIPILFFKGIIEEKEEYEKRGLFMFADLCKYESQDFYREHKTIRFDTLDSFGEYEVIAAFKTVAYSEEGFKYYHFVNAESAGAFDGYIAECKALALYDTGVSAEYGDQLITLSTCEYSRTNGRMVVVAKLLEE